MNPLKKISPYLWEVPREYKPGMRVPGIIYASSKMIEHILKERVIEQVANVACLPGIVKYSLAMPDAHWGYGFPIGGVAAFDPEKDGVISPGGVGYDINCGVRLVRSDLTLDDLKPHLERLINALFNNVPCGVGVGGKIKLSPKEEREVLVKGARWAVEEGMGIKEDLEATEEGGELKGARPELISPKAYERGRGQVGTLGSGNHFLEVQVVDEIYDEKLAKTLGIFLGQITIMIHSGSRGFGHQVCDDNLKVMQRAVEKYGIKLPDRQLACAPINSPEGENYFAQMACAANYAWCNRQIIMHLVRETFQKVFGKSWEKLGLYLVYDVAHNIAKFEEYQVDGKKKTLCVHRKGATRAFPPHHPQVPLKYRGIGQPVIIPGDMGRCSYLLIGTEKAFKDTWGSTCHGAGRMMSRHEAIRQARGRSIYQEMMDRGIIVRAKGKHTLAEEMPQAYKDVRDVVEVVDKAGISRKIARMRPLGVVKG
ncbi:MAG: RNA-splicing ligase RtcB [Thermoprotei archaeon]|nr:MAG: RNA-splicing ligase RtcB [Thermoprotei archaeon]